MEMKEQTIVDKYIRLGVKPKILAELNACPTKDIENILAKAGVYTPKPTKKRGKNMAAEQKARTTYDNILRLVKDPEVCDPIRFLREREIVHFQRFGESLRIIQDDLDSKNFYAFNPEFDVPACNR